MHDLSIAKKGELNLNRHDFNINKLEEELIVEYKIYSQKRKLNFQFDNKTKGDIFLGDLRRIKQAVSELLQNAIKYTEDDGTIMIRLDKEITNDIHYFTIEVSDTGIGIAKDKVDKIFSEFYEIQNSMEHHTSKTEFMGGGMGIGLSIVKEIVKAYDGEIKVETEPDKGAKFKIYLPYGTDRKLEQISGTNQ
jgi:signal transduction histidine kinase